MSFEAQAEYVYGSIIADKETFITYHCKMHVRCINELAMQSNDLHIQSCRICDFIWLTTLQSRVAPLTQSPDIFVQFGHEPKSRTWERTLYPKILFIVHTIVNFDHVCDMASGFWEGILRLYIKPTVSWLQFWARYCIFMHLKNTLTYFQEINLVKIRGKSI